MQNTDIKRIARLTAILTQLQTRRFLTANQLADKFCVSVRTIYRDIRVLEQAGVPVLSLEGKGYTIMEHYRLPPVMFTEDEANALITAEQLVLQNKDHSFIKAYAEAIAKIKAVLNHNLKDKANLLAERVYYWPTQSNIGKSSSYLSSLQFALTNFLQTSISYVDESNNITKRTIEPFALVGSQDKWLLIAWCRLRKAFRHFRLDRIEKLDVLSEKFDAHDITLQEFYEKFY